MAIVKMNKLSVIGMNEEKKSLLKDLMDLGVVEISSSTDKLQDEEWRKLVVRDGDETTAAQYDKEVSRTEAALDVLARYGEVKKPLFNVKKTISAEDSLKLASQGEKFRQEVDELISLNDQLNEAFSQENTDNNLIASLRPWTSYELPLEETHTDRIQLRLGVCPPTADVNAASEALEAEGLPCVLTELNRDKDQCYLSLWYFTEDQEKVFDVVKGCGFTLAQLGELTGTVSQNIERLEAEVADLAGRRDKLTADIKDRASWLEDLHFYHDINGIRRDEARIRSKLVKTESTFTFDGWVPVAANTAVSQLLEKYTCWFQFEEPAEDDDIPTQLSNKSFFEPAEFITRMYSLPNAREVDPTPIFTFFYILFFGIMFGDVGYGLILMVATGLVIKRSGMKEGAVLQLMKVLFYSGISSVIWGFLFGSFFGDLIGAVTETFGSHRINFSPLWLDPAQKAMFFLAFSCGLGVIHLFVGMGIKAYEEIKDGKILEAINDVFIWYLIVIGIILWIFGGRVGENASAIGKWMSIVGFVLAIVLPIFIEKGAGKGLGLWNIYSGVTGNLSDILSYSRLLGLGLASSSIATVINFLATMGGKGFAGIVMFILIELFGHTLNFAINALGAFVHSCRLQFVEFFGKFYEGGGREFEPFKKDTTFVNIVEEGK